jgi:AMP phosphorylase
MERTLKARKIDIAQGTYEVVLNQDDADELWLKPNDRVKIVCRDDSISALVDITDTLIQKDELGIFIDLWDVLKLKDGEEVRIIPTSRPASIDFIRKKIYANPWTKEEINTIINDIALGNLSDIELSAYATAVQINGLNMDEITWLTTAMVGSGETIDFEASPILDVHSIGGVPGNKYAPITVAIVAANGLIIPKTSSRAISSAAGTADIMETLCNVEFDAQSIKRIARETNGALVWGGGVNLAPADDAIIRVEYPLSLDPHGQVLASVMAKKKAIGADYCVIDIPVGEGTKVVDNEQARQMARDFITLGERLGIRTMCTITYGGQPVGRAIGPALEIKEALSVLEGSPKPNSLIEKSLSLAGILLELGGVAQPKKGRDLAKDTLGSKKALEKFKEIINAQGGNPDVKSDDIHHGKYTYDLPSPKDGYIEAVKNRAVTKIARTAGSPKDKGAGVVLGYKRGESAAEGDTLLTIYAENERKLSDAKSLANKLQPVVVEGMILEEIVE